MDEQFEVRKEKIFNFFKSNMSIIQYLLLGIIIWIGKHIRVQTLDKLIDNTTNIPISLELDSTLFLRYAQYISEHGRIFLIDTMRFYPVGGNVDIGIFSAYFVAYLQKILSVFINISIETTNNIYPIVSMAILTIFLFLLVRRLFDWRVGLLSAFLLNISPAFLFRSLGGSSDHDILGITLAIMVLYFFVVSWQYKTKAYKILMSIISAFIVLIGLNTAGSIQTSLVVISFFFMIEIILDKVEDFDIYSLVPFTAIIFILGPFFTSVSFLGFVTSISTSFLALATVSILVMKLIKKNNINIKLPIGISSVLFSTAVFIILIGLFFGLEFLISRIKDIMAPLFKNTFTVNRWILTVAENKRPYIIDWFQNFGKYYVLAFIAGSVILFYDALKKFNKVKELTFIYTLFIIGYIFSRYSQDSVLNGESNLAKYIFFGSIILFFGTMIIGYIYLYIKKHKDFDSIKNIDKKYAFVLVWFLVMIFAATSAIRLFFEFTPITTILFSFFIFQIFDYFWNKKEVFIKYSVVILIILFIFSPFSFAQGIATRYYDSSINSAKAIGPGYNVQWQRTGDWVRNNTPRDAVFIHWWDYGYWVQSGFKRATVTDGGNFFGWWNYLTGREVLTNPNISSSLKFLKAHNVTNLLIISDEIGKYSAYSSIGSDQNYDRFSYINTFSLAPEQTEKTRNSTVLVFAGNYPFDESIILSDQVVLPASSSGVVQVKVPINIDGNNNVLGIGQPIAIVAYNNQGLGMPMRCVFFDKMYEFENYGIDSCFRILPSFNQGSQNANQFGAGLYLSRRVYHGLMGQLYLLNQESEYYKLVYDDSTNGMPLAYVNGAMIGPHKIWEINYPKDLTLSGEEYEYYLRTTYPDDSLNKP